MPYHLTMSLTSFPTSIALARAFYQDKDIYLLDDPLASLDNHVGKEVLESIVQLVDKTRILVTHNPSIAKYADQVIIMDDGQIKVDSTFSNIPEEFLDLFSKENCGPTFQVSTKEQPQKGEQTKKTNLFVQQEADIQEDEDLSRERTWKNYFHFFEIAFRSSPTGVICVIVFVLVNHLLSEAAQFWSGYWIDLEEGHHLKGNFIFVFVFASLLIAEGSLRLISSLVQSTVSTKIGNFMHFSLLRSLLHTFVSFFDRTSIGKIHKRFTTDHFDASELLVNAFSILHKQHTIVFLPNHFEIFLKCRFALLAINMG